MDAGFRCLICVLTNIAFKTGYMPTLMRGYKILVFVRFQDQVTFTRLFTLLRDRSASQCYHIHQVSSNSKLLCNTSDKPIATPENCHPSHETEVMLMRVLMSSDSLEHAHSLATLTCRSTRGARMQPKPRVYDDEQDKMIKFDLCL